MSLSDKDHPIWRLLRFSITALIIYAGFVTVIWFNAKKFDADEFAEMWQMAIVLLLGGGSHFIRR
jgi:hypothetical protein